MPVEYKRDSLDMIMDIDFITESTDRIEVTSEEEFEQAKREFLKCFYVGLHRRDNALTIVTDTGKYFIVDLDTVPVEPVVKSFIFIKPKKVVFDISNYRDLICEETKGFIDIQLAFDLLANNKFPRLNDLIVHYKFPKKSYANLYLLYSNLINVAKQLNIYTEKNKLNKVYYMEMDTAILLSNISNRGVDININTYEDINKSTNEEINIYSDEFKNIYGNDFDISNKEDLLKAVKEGPRSLEPGLVSKSEDPLYKYHKAYTLKSWLDSLFIEDGKLYMDYETYEDYRIKSNIALDKSFYGNEETTVIKGEFGQLYHRVFAELSRNRDLIVAASENRFIEYFNNELYVENESIGVFTDIMLRCLAMGEREPFDIQKRALESFDTILNVGDISRFTFELEEKMGEVFEFVTSFKGTEPEYERYNKKIFTPDAHLDAFIKQIINIIFKRSLIDMEKLTRDYTLKRRKSEEDQLYICGIGEDVILVAAIGEDAIQMAMDNLNRVMFANYKSFVKNTSVFNTTSQINI